MAITGLSDALDPNIVTGSTINIVGPPSTQRDSAPPPSNTVAFGASQLDPYKGPGSVYETISANYPTLANPAATLSQVAAISQQQYDNLVNNRVSTPAVTSITVEYLTLDYPANYGNNQASVSVPTKKLTFNGQDGRTLVAYYANYDKIAAHNNSILWQINGHFGTNPTRQALGIENNGGLTGGALGKLAIEGLPLISYDDHNVGESTAAPVSLPRTLENLEMLDQTLLTSFGRVDVLGLSGGTERAYHLMMLYNSNIESVYYAGYATPVWMRETPPFPPLFPEDTEDNTFEQNFSHADLAVVGLANGIDTAFAHNTFDDGNSKYGYFSEIVPQLSQFTTDFHTRGDDTNGDGVSETGQNLQHEYDLVDVTDWLNTVRQGSTVSQWNVNGLGNWNQPINWSPTTVPNGANRTAILGSTITSDSTVVVDSSVTLNRLQFDDGNKYAVAGTQDITFATDPSVPDPTLEVISGGHEIQVRTNLSADLSVTVDASSTLDFNNQIDLNGMTLDTTGGAGTVNINHSSVGGGSITAAGVLGTAGSTSLGGSLSSSGTLAIDLGFTSTDRFDVTGAATISGMLDVTLEAGFTPSSDVTILTASSVDTTGLTLNDPSGFFSGFDSSSGTSIILQLASGLDGDFDGSGFVDAADYTVWRDNLGTNNLLPNDNIGGSVTEAHYLQWKNNFGNTAGSGSSSGAAVPEPVSACLLIVAWGGISLVSRRREGAM